MNRLLDRVTPLVAIGAKHLIRMTRLALFEILLRIHLMFSQPVDEMIVGLWYALNRVDILVFAKRWGRDRQGDSEDRQRAPPHAPCFRF